MRSLITCLLICFVFSIGRSAHAEAPVRLYLYELDHRLQADGDDQYNALLADLLKDTEDKLELFYTPLSRAPHFMERDPQSCYFPANKRAITSTVSINTPLLASVPLDIVSMRVYLPEGKPDITSFEDLADMRSSYIIGSAAGVVLGAYATDIAALKTESQVINMLRRDRLDAFFGHHPDTPIALEELGAVGMLQVSAINPDLLRFPVSVVCFDFEGARDILRIINRNTINLHRSGRIQQFLGRHAEYPTDAVLDDWIKTAYEDAPTIN